MEHSLKFLRGKRLFHQPLAIKKKSGHRLRILGAKTRRHIHNKTAREDWIWQSMDIYDYSKIVIQQNIILSILG